MTFDSSKDFSTEAKDLIRIALTKKITPETNILTLPSEKGLCVMEFIKAGATPDKIRCVEKEKTIYEKYVKLNLGTVNFRMNLRKYMDKLNEISKYNLIFLDFCGGLSEDNIYIIKKAINQLYKYGRIGMTLCWHNRHKTDMEKFIIYEDMKGKLHKRTNVPEIVKDLFESSNGTFDDICEIKYDSRTGRNEMLFMLFERLS